MRLSKNLGMLLLGIWLITAGAISLFGIRIPNSDTILAILGIAAGVSILLGR